MEGLQRLAVDKFSKVDIIEADPDDMAEAAELAWSAPSATRYMQDAVVAYATCRNDLYDGSGLGSLFDQTMRRVPGLAYQIAKEERKLRLQPQGNDRKIFPNV